jgi:hypothetical protein
MTPSATRRAPWLQVSLKTLCVLLLVVAAFFAGEGIAARRAAKPVRDAQEAADAARQQEEQTRRELELERAKWGPPPRAPDANLPEQPDGRRDWPAP